MIRIQKILYPTDFSSYSTQAYFHAVSLAEMHGASLTILFVYSPALDTSLSRSSGLPPRKYWKNQLEQIRPVDPHIAVEHVLLEGAPAPAIVRYSREAGINLIVMGTHGRSGPQQPVLGSVAEQVMREASCSVLVVKLPSAVPAPVHADVEVVASPL